jgi:hypothetical protein
MVNINTHLPSAVALPFHPPTESLQHDNLIKPIIPKTEIIASYTKMREQEESSQLSDQARSIIQNGDKQAAEQPSHQNSSANQKRALFFARRGAFSASEAEKGDAKLVAIKDFKEVISVIQARYKNAVNPLPDPVIDYAI